MQWKITHIKGKRAKNSSYFTFNHCKKKKKKKKKEKKKERRKRKTGYFFPGSERTLI